MHQAPNGRNEPPPFDIRTLLSYCRGMTMEWTQENERLWMSPGGYTIVQGFHLVNPFTLRSEGWTERPRQRFPSLADAQRAAESHADARLEAPLTRGPGDVEYAVPEHVGAVDAALSAQDRAEAQEQERQDREDVAQARLEELADTWPTPACPDAAAGKPHPTHRIEGTWREQCPGVESGDAADAPEVVAGEASLADRMASQLARVDAVLDEAMAQVAHWRDVVSLASALRNSLAREAHHGLMSTLPAWAAPVVPQEASEDLAPQEGSERVWRVGDHLPGNYPHALLVPAHHTTRGALVLLDGGDKRVWEILRYEGGMYWAMPFNAPIDEARWQTGGIFTLVAPPEPLNETPARRSGDFRPGDIVRLIGAPLTSRSKVLHAQENGNRVRIIAMDLPGAIPMNVSRDHLAPWE